MLIIKLFCISRIFIFSIKRINSWSTVALLSVIEGIAVLIRRLAFIYLKNGERGYKIIAVYDQCRQEGMVTSDYFLRSE